MLIDYDANEGASGENTKKEKKLEKELANQESKMVEEKQSNEGQQGGNE